MLYCLVCCKSFKYRSSLAKHEQSHCQKSIKIIIPTCDIISSQNTPFPDLSDERFVLNDIDLDDEIDSEITDATNEMIDSEMTDACNEIEYTTEEDEELVQDNAEYINDSIANFTVTSIEELLDGSSDDESITLDLDNTGNDEADESNAEFFVSICSDLDLEELTIKDELIESEQDSYNQLIDNQSLNDGSAFKASGEHSRNESTETWNTDVKINKSSPPMKFKTSPKNSPLIMGSPLQNNSPFQKSSPFRNSSPFRRCSPLQIKSPFRMDSPSQRNSPLKEVWQVNPAKKSILLDLNFEDNKQIVNSCNSVYDLNNRSRSPVKEAPLLCKICNRVFKYKKSFDKHESQQNCDVASNSNNLSTTDEEIKYLTGIETNTEDNLNKHFEESADNNLLFSNDNSEDKAAQNLIQNIETNSGEEISASNEFGASQNSIENIETNSGKGISASNETPLNCKICNKEFKYKKSFDKHEKLQDCAILTENSPLSDEENESLKVNEYEIEASQHSIENEKNNCDVEMDAGNRTLLVCKICNREFKYKKAFDKHERQQNCVILTESIHPSTAEIKSPLVIKYLLETETDIICKDLDRVAKSIDSVEMPSSNVNFETEDFNLKGNDNFSETKEEPLICKICNRVFRYKRSFDKHGRQQNCEVPLDSKEMESPIVSENQLQKCVVYLQKLHVSLRNPCQVANEDNLISKFFPITKAIPEEIGDMETNVTCNDQIIENDSIPGRELKKESEMSSSNEHDLDAASKEKSLTCQTCKKVFKYKKSFDKHQERQNCEVPMESGPTSHNKIQSTPANENLNQINQGNNIEPFTDDKDLKNKIGENVFIARRNTTIGLSTYMDSKNPTLDLDKESLTTTIVQSKVQSSDHHSEEKIFVTAENYEVNKKKGVTDVNKTNIVSSKQKTFSHIDKGQIILTNLFLSPLGRTTTCKPEEDHNFLCEMCPASFDQLILLKRHEFAHFLDEVSEDDCRHEDDISTSQNKFR